MSYSEAELKNAGFCVCQGVCECTTDANGLPMYGAAWPVKKRTTVVQTIRDWWVRCLKRGKDKL